MSNADSAAARANLMETKKHPSTTPEERCRLNGLAIFFVLVLILVCSAAAQDSIGSSLVNQLSVTGDELSSARRRSKIRFQLPRSPYSFRKPGELEFNYARLLKTRGIFGVFAELPVAIYPRMDLNTYVNQIPHDIGALFVTPSVRVNIFATDSVSPWVSVGGGYARFRESPQLNFYGNPNPGSTGTNTGVVQFGGGLDVWVLASLGRALRSPRFLLRASRL
jgi:hypothetical protein